MSNYCWLIDQSHKSHNAPVPYPTMHHFVTEMCTFLLQNGALWDIYPMHYGICEMSLLHWSMDSDWYCVWLLQFGVNTLRLRQNGRHFADDIFLNAVYWYMHHSALMSYNVADLFSENTKKYKISLQWDGDSTSAAKLLFYFSWNSLASAHFIANSYHPTC